MAEDYHQNYAALNPGQPYIQYVSQPKVEKLRTYFGDRLRDKTASLSLGRYLKATSVPQSRG